MRSEFGIDLVRGRYGGNMGVALAYFWSTLYSITNYELWITNGTNFIRIGTKWL